MRGQVMYEKREVETSPLNRGIMVHMAMNYKCDCCGTVFTFWLEKGLEDKKQDAIYPDLHKPVPFTTPCLCGGTLEHVMWHNDLELDEYRELGVNENYFENTESERCGISHIRNYGRSLITARTMYEEAVRLAEIENEREKKREELIRYASDDDPYGLAHVSTTTLKKELRRRKGGKTW